MGIPGSKPTSTGLAAAPPGTSRRQWGPEAMETRASHVIVGAFVLVTLFALAGFVMWLTHAQINQEFARYDIYFLGSVSGLQDGGSVRYRGVPIGTVKQIRINPANTEQVHVMIEVQKEVPIRADSVASLELQGITGLAYVQISGGTHASPLLSAAPGQANPVIPAAPSKLEQVFESAPVLLDRVILLTERAIQVMSAENVAAVSATLKNVAGFSAVLAAESGEFKALIGEASEAATLIRAGIGELDLLARELRVSSERAFTAVNQTMTTVDRQVGRVGGDASRALDDVAKAAAAFTDLSRRLDRLIAVTEDPLRDFAGSGLHETALVLNELRILIAGLNRVIVKVERDPAQFLFGDTQQGYQPR
ncbi:MAG: MCE family protein [Alphaproteobacteria bacterium]|nr:MCE family protein [Alphaproteobacteria bacterium]